MKKFIQSFIIASISLLCSQAFSDSVQQATKHDKKYSLEVFPYFDGTGVVLNPNFAINEKFSIGMRFPVPIQHEMLAGSVLANYYFSTFSTDSFFLQPHFGIDTNLPIEIDNLPTFNQGAYTYGLDWGYRFVFNERFTVRPMILNIYAVSEVNPILPLLPYIMVGYVW